MTITTLMQNSAIALAVGGAALLWNGTIPTSEHASLISTADARIGRPLTPFSYAGVARRTTRRAVAVGVGVGAVGVGVAATRAYTVGTAAAATRAYTVGTAAAATTTAVRATAPHGCVRVIGPLGRAATVCR
jgi:hypothetical protein